MFVGSGVVGGGGRWRLGRADVEGRGCEGWRGRGRGEDP